jgi:glycogen synthase
MRVLMFGWEFPPFISGGLGTASYGIAKGLVNNQVDIKFVIPTKRGQHIDGPCPVIAANEVPLIKKYHEIVQKSERINKQLFEKAFVISPYYTTESYKEYFENFEKIKIARNTVGEYQGVLDFTGNYGHDLMNEVGRYGFIGEILGLGEDFDIIHAHDWLTYYAGVTAKLVSGKPLVVHVHATEFDRSGENVNQAVYDIERYGMENADKIVAVSYYTKNIIVNRYGIDPDKVEVIHNAVDKARNFDGLGIRKNLKEKIVLFLGRVTMQKGPDYFVEAAYLVYKKMKNVRFVMAGSGDLLPRMILRMAHLRMTDRFHFTGFLKGIDVEKMYAMSDLYVMPSVSEPFGISPFEALLYDVPIIISKQSGVAEVLKNAVKVDFWDVQRLAEMIIMLLEKEDIAREVVEKSKGDLQNVAWDSASFKLKTLYESMLV